jgi:hypothetical protein
MAGEGEEDFVQHVGELGAVGERVVMYVLNLVGEHSGSPEQISGCLCCLLHMHRSFLGPPFGQVLVKEEQCPENFESAAHG